MVNDVRLEERGHIHIYSEDINRLPYFITWRTVTPDAQFCTPHTIFKIVALSQNGVNWSSSCGSELAGAGRKSKIILR